MSTFATREEVQLLRERLGRAEIQSHIGINFAYIALRFTRDAAGVLAALEKSYEAGLTELTFSKTEDEDIEFYKKTYRAYIDQVSQLFSS